MISSTRWTSEARRRTRRFGYTQNVTPEDAYERWQSGGLTIIDCRESDEHERSQIAGVPLIPMSEIADRVDDIPTDTPLAVICHAGGRSTQVADVLNAQGEFGTVESVDGGIQAWAAAGLPYEGDSPD